MVGREGGRQLAKLTELQVDLSSFLSFHCEHDLVAQENEVSGGPRTNFTVDLPCLLLKIKTPAALPGSNYILRFKWLLGNDAKDLKEDVEKQYNSISKSNSLAQPSHFLVPLFIYFLRPLYDYDVKLSYATFYKRWEHVARSKPFFFSLLELERFKRVRLKL